MFVTVGHQMPFDRLIRAVDQWAGASGREDVFAQIGSSSYRPANLAYCSYLSPEDFASRLNASKAVVAHAGTGTIISCLQISKPLLVLPRRAELGETRTSHQIGTARYFGESGLILTADTEEELQTRLDELASFKPSGGLRPPSPELISRVRGMIFEHEEPDARS